MPASNIIYKYLSELSGKVTDLSLQAAAKTLQFFVWGFR